MPSWTSREVIKRLKDDGWVQVAKEGSHAQFKHPKKSEKITVPHPKKDLAIKTVKSISQQAGWPWSGR